MEDYERILKQVADKYKKPYYQISHEAWIYSSQNKETIIGLMASDNTGWQDKFEKKLKNFDYGTYWNSKSPVGGKNTLKQLKSTIEDGDSFLLFWKQKNKIIYRGEVVDFATSQEELETKQWNKNGDVLQYYDKFSNYKDKKKSAKIVFLLRDFKKVPEIDISDFKFYADYKPPTQDNLAPIAETKIEMNNNSQYQHSKNQILFGPPGTGKTYNTVNYAVSIIENKSVAEICDVEKLESGREKLKKRFEEYVKKAQIVFTTFHQSMCPADSDLQPR